MDWNFLQQWNKHRSKNCEKTSFASFAQKKSKPLRYYSYLSCQQISTFYKTLVLKTNGSIKRQLNCKLDGCKLHLVVESCNETIPCCYYYCSFSQNIIVKVECNAGMLQWCAVYLINGPQIIHFWHRSLKFECLMENECVYHIFWLWPFSA